MKVKWGEWGYRVFPVVILLLLRVLLDLGKIGGWGFWLGNVLLAAGWIIGWMMAEGDHLMYALVCDPSSPTCSMVRTYTSIGQWRMAWKTLEATKAERTKLPIRNMLSVLVVTGVGLWVITSSGSFLGSGVVLGLCTRLLLDLWKETDYRKWYWVFAREFSKTEHRGLTAAVAAAVAVQFLMVLR